MVPSIRSLLHHLKTRAHISSFSLPRLHVIGALVSCCCLWCVIGQRVHLRATRIIHFCVCPLLCIPGRSDAKCNTGYCYEGGQYTQVIFARQTNRYINLCLVFLQNMHLIFPSEFMHWSDIFCCFLTRGWLLFWLLHSENGRVKQIILVIIQWPNEE